LSDSSNSSSRETPCGGSATGSVDMADKLGGGCVTKARKIKKYKT
jgi:hypothetical protein